MTHFGIICPAAGGHSNPMSALAIELVSRGHRCTFFQVCDWEEAIRSQGLDFHSIGVREFPPGSWNAVLERLGHIDGLDSLKFTIEAWRRNLEIICRDVPPALERLGVDALLVDQCEPGGTSVAEHVGVPAVTLCMAMLLNQHKDIPPAITPWKYRPIWWARWRNRVGYFALNRLSAPIMRTLGEQRRHWGLPPFASFNDTCSPLAQISQQPREFEFPRTHLPDTFHFCGPLRRLDAYQGLEGELASVAETDRPLIYGSLGTIQNRKKELFWTMAAACAELDVQLVIAHSGVLSDEEARSLPGRTLAVRWVPQPAILKNANLCITHCGMNTVLDALSQGVPCVGIPQAHEQPAIARRLEWTGTGISLGVDPLTPRSLRAGIEKLLGEPAYYQAARRLQAAIKVAGGVIRAADICEQVAASRQAVSSIG